MATFAEFSVLLGYLKNTGFPEMGLNLQELNTLSFALFYEWICYQTMVSTLRNGGDKSNLTYFADESHLMTNYEQLLKFLSTSEDILDPKNVAE